MKIDIKEIPDKDAEMPARYTENPYLILFDKAEKIGVFDFFKNKENAVFFPLEDLFEYCLERYPLSKEKKVSDSEHRPGQTLYFLMLCLSTEEIGFFKKKGEYFSKSYEGEVKESVQFKMLESGLLNHLFDLKNILDFSQSYDYFSGFDRLIIDPDIYRADPLSEKLFTEEGKVENYLSGLARLAYSQLPEFLAICDLRGYKTILDIGSGACIYDIGILKKYKETRIFGLDFDIINKWRFEKKYDGKDQENIGNFIDDLQNGKNLKNRFTFINIPKNKKDAIFEEESWNNGKLQNKNFDCILIQNILHHNSKKHGEWLIQKCYNKLNIGGKIVVQDYFKEIDGLAPFAAVIFSLYFRSISLEGQTYSHFELANMLFNAGFRKIKCQKISELSFLIEAYKSVESKKIDYFVDSILKKLDNIKEPICIESFYKEFEKIDFRMFYTIAYITEFKQKIIGSKIIKKVRLISKEMIGFISNPDFNIEEHSYWFFLFFLSVMDRSDREELYSQHRHLFRKIIEETGLDLNLRLFFLFLFFIEDLPFSSEQVEKLKEEYSTISKGLQHYFGSNPEACKMNLIRRLIEKDRMKDPTSFIYIFSLRLFLKYNILDRYDTDYLSLVEEFSQNNEILVRDEISKINKSLKEE